MITTTQAEGILLRIAVAALNYYPDKPTAEPGYRLDDDLDWCLDALPAFLTPYRDSLRERMAEIITDPVTHREAFVRDILDLVAPAPAA